MARTTLALILLAGMAPRLPAELHCEQPVLNAGEVRSGTPLTHRFRVTNRGGAAVEVVDVRSSCGCLKPVLDRRVLEPGAEASVAVEVNTLTQESGPRGWQTRLIYREGERQAELALVVQARVVTEVLVQPASLRIFTTAGVEHALTVTDLRPGAGLKVASVATSSPVVQARLDGTQQDASGRLIQRIKVRVSGEHPEGEHEEVLCIHTSDPAHAALRVPLTIVKRSRTGVQPSPAEVRLSQPASAPLPSTRVLLRVATDEPIEVQRIETSDPAIQARWLPGPGSRVTLKVEIDQARASAGGLAGEVRVHLSRPAAQTVTVPVTWEPRSAGENGARP